MTDYLFYALCAAFAGAVLGVFITLLCVWALRERRPRFAPDADLAIGDGAWMRCAENPLDFFPSNSVAIVNADDYARSYVRGSDYGR